MKAQAMPDGVKKNFMDDILYNACMWILRLAVPCLIFSIYCINKTKQWNPHAATLGSSKWHQGKEKESKLFSVDDHDMSTITEDFKNSRSLNTAPSYTRDALLACRVKLSGIGDRLFNITAESGAISRSNLLSSAAEKVDVNPCSVGDIRVDKPSVGLVISPDNEREYLQSLLHFRAFKSNFLKDADWDTWNVEAQKILTGNILYPNRNIAPEVYETLLSAGVFPDCETFGLFVKASTVCDDYKSARMFLASMSNAGFTPPKSLVDEVLYKWSTKPSNGRILNKDAPAFVPAGFSGIKCTY